MSTATHGPVRADQAPPSRPAPVRGSDTRGRGWGGRIFNGFSHAFLVVWAVMVLYPLLWVVMSAFKDDSQVIREPLSLIPHKLHWGNFARAWGEGHLGAFFLNTVLVMVGSVTLTMLLGSMAAYALARYEFPGNRLIYYMFLSGLTLPIYLAAVPLFKGVYNTGISFPLLGPNKHLMLILVYVAWSLSFTIFFMHSFFRTLPDSIAEAAQVDGASHTRTFFSVMLPMARPGLISIGIFNVLGQWNQWYLPTLLMQSVAGEPKHQVIAQGLIELSVNQGYKSDWSGLFAGVTMAMLPVLIVYIVFQRQVQSGLTAGVSK
ncbi:MULTISPECIES: carbohydrate ABC transporter permease [Micromonospora]|uniref:Carbohydrate ABC transporter permease n=1 Tax=Micromonospora solifontis TaxID=2487138 RepID=A0ABX9WI15_9ACTN|nr:MULTISPECIES: carbohydrate ABC transporter permease [Micromonospora]NES14996.1 carbohydrate ABC transporter permease [Micromonospora sp. PPF5-17B]NES37555.1 carbohydrate ABC transporter permease [Micromonospora solifontis]NES57521.1 carbohydrate ABC transporter permease [Micromonospora sp. PPF5-6]RNL98178.1 carbohydrate ABC transporter permease [Micromonospora solifontis]